MYTTISGIYENGKIILQENAPTEKSMKVLVTFVEETDMPPNQTTIKALEAAERGEISASRYRIYGELFDELSKTRW